MWRVVVIVGAVAIGLNLGILIMGCLVAGGTSHAHPSR